MQVKALSFLKMLVQFLDKRQFDIVQPAAYRWNFANVRRAIFSNFDNSDDIAGAV